MEKVILTTGGTGGHIFPAIAVAEELKSRNPATEILFIGSNYGPEAKIAASHAIPFAGLEVRGLMGRGLKAVPAAFSLGVATLQALKIIRRFRPDAIAGFGGYASFAPVLAASLLHVPVLLHEQNAIAGSSNKFLSRLAARICVSLPDTKGFSKKMVVTGNPVRAGIRKNASRNFGGKKLVVLGGSQGAHALNTHICEILKDLKDAGVEILHQSGEKDYEAVRAAYVENGFSAQSVKPFIDDMPKAYAWADLAVCRSGASTIAELCAAGLPSVLVPFPSAIHDHQTLNARELEKNGAAILIPEMELENSRLAQTINRLFGDPQQLEQMSHAALKLARPDAASLVADELETL